jgi:hypothetical protein
MYDDGLADRVRAYGQASYRKGYKDGYLSGLITGCIIGILSIFTVRVIQK